MSFHNDWRPRIFSIVLAIVVVTIPFKSGLLFSTDSDDLSSKPYIGGHWFDMFLIQSNNNSGQGNVSDQTKTTATCAPIKMHIPEDINLPFSGMVPDCEITAPPSYNMFSEWKRVKNQIVTSSPATPTPYKSAALVPSQTTTTKPTTLPNTTATATPTPSITQTPISSWKPVGEYLIDVERFGIHTDKTNAKKTTSGINSALAWASSMGYGKVTLPMGAYLIDGVEASRFWNPQNGIRVPSNMIFDLNGAHLYIEPNSSAGYTGIAIVYATNVTIRNGFIHGEKDEHNYVLDSASKTHEYGFGINVVESTNITIEDMVIDKCTGDGILLGGYRWLYEVGAVNNDNISIMRNKIFDCRRQGISVVAGTNCNIYENNIYNIGGTDPQAGIDVEPELDFKTFGTKIYRNTIKNTVGPSISAHSGSGYEIYENTVHKMDILAVISKDVRIYDNILLDNSKVVVYPSAANISLTKQ